MQLPMCHSYFSRIANNHAGSLTWGHSCLEEKHFTKKNHTKRATISKAVARTTRELIVQEENDTSAIFIAITYSHIKHCNILQL